MIVRWPSFAQTANWRWSYLKAAMESLDDPHDRAAGLLAQGYSDTEDSSGGLEGSRDETFRGVTCTKSVTSFPAVE